MAYRRTRRSSASSYRVRRPRRATRRRRTARRSSTKRIVIQVVGPGGSGVPASAMNLGKKGNKPVRARY